jgi:hypothetical protein
VVVVVPLPVICFVRLPAWSYASFSVTNAEPLPLRVTVADAYVLTGYDGYIPGVPRC